MAVTTDPAGKQKWTTIGAADAMSIDAAREKARTILLRVRGQGAASFKEVAEQYVQRHVGAKGIRTQSEIERCLTKYVYPHWEHRDFTGIKRGDISSLLDGIEDSSGPRQADCVLTIIRAISNFHAKRNDDYVSPFVRGMGRAENTKRARILDDAGRAIWRTADGTFGDIIRIALLTAQRREKVVGMKWSDVSIDGEWAIPSGHRQKGTGGTLMLPKLARQILGARYRVVGNPYIFPGSATGHFNGFSPCKRALDAKLPDIPG